MFFVFWSTYRLVIKNKHLALWVVSSVATATLPILGIAEDKISIQVQKYQENDDRINIEDGKLSIEHDFGTDHTVNAEVDWDTISGASPTWTFDSDTGASKVVTEDSSTMASPCIDEDRKYICRDTRWNNIVGDGYKEHDEFSYKNVELDDHRDSLALLYTFRTPTMRNELSVGASYSKEGDFINSGASIEYLMYTDRTKNRGVTLGASYMKNEVYDYLEDIWNNFDLINLQLSITQVFNKRMVGKLSAYAVLEDGHLSNPYFNVVRRVNVANDEVLITNFKYYLSRELRPENRKAGGLSLQVVKQVNPLTQWHISYRFYHDSWSVYSNTIESKSYHKVANKIRISPSLRYYQQGAARFFKAHDARDNIFSEVGYASADDRLGDYSSWTAQLGFEFIQTTKITWNIVTGYQNQSSGLKFGWVNLGAEYKY